MNYIQCSKCGKLLKTSLSENEIKITNETSVFWCNDCITKHLNSTEVTE